VAYTTGMSPSRAATAVVVIVGLWAAIAHAERRPVAVIDLTLSDANADTVRGLLDDLGSHSELRRLQNAAYEAALVGAPIDDDAPLLGSATTSIELAERYLAEFKPDAANSGAGTASLVQVSPTRAMPLFARIAFVRGQAHLALKKPEDAKLWFTLVHALEPAKKLDPDQFFPEVIATFEAAVPPTDKSAKLDIRGTGEIWIDGASYGAAPRIVDIAPGRHVVQLTGVDRETRGDFHDAKPGEVTPVAILDTPASPLLQIRRARIALATAPGGVERAALMTRLAKLIGVGDAVLLSTTDGKVTVQTWRDRAPGFSKVEPRGKRTTTELLVALAPPPPPKTPPPPEVIFPIEQPRWYEDRKVQAAVVFGVAAVIVASVLWATAPIDMRPAFEDVGVR